jgi:hypothetical protein
VRNVVRLTTITALAVVCARSATAQSTVALATSAGSFTDALGVRSNGISAATVLTSSGPRVASAFTLGGTLFDSRAWSAGVSAALLGRQRIVGPASLSAIATGRATRTSFDATLASADVTPTLEWSWRWSTLYGGVRAAAGVTVMEAQGTLPLPGAVQFATDARTASGLVYGARMDAPLFRARSMVRLTAEATQMRVDGVRIDDRLAGARVLTRRFDLGVQGGMRDVAAISSSRSPVGGTSPTDGSGRTLFGTVSSSVNLSPSVTLELGGGSYPADRLTGGAAGRFASAGLRVRFGGLAARLPKPAGIPAPLHGVTRLSIRAPRAERVDVLGDWNGWQPIAAQRAANGVWYVDVPLTPGEYRYAFRIDGREWRVPEGVAAVDDGFGSRSAYITVRDGRVTQ